MCIQLPYQGRELTSLQLKCDELKPVCSRCIRLGVDCGYPPQSLKWSTKHEVRRSEASSQSPVSTPRPLGELQFDLNTIPSPTAPELDWTQLLFQPALDSAVQDHSDTTMFTQDANWDALSWQMGLSAPPHSTALTPVQSTALRATREKPAAQRRQQTMLQALQGRRSEVSPRIQTSLTHESSELISYYFKEVPGVYSMYDSQKNIFRSAVSNLLNHSLPVNLAAQSMAAGFLVEVHPRFASIGRKLRREAMELIQKEPSRTDYNAMLALSMFGPTGNWIEASDLGIQFYGMMRDRVNAVRSSGLLGNDNYRFFEEALVFWEMNLAFVVDDSVIKPGPSAERLGVIVPSQKRTAHPWTGVAGEVIQIVADIGRLVRAHRARMLKQKFVTQACLDQLSRDLIVARDLERQLLSYQSPDEGSIADLEDNATSIQHLTTLAEVYRYAGLLQLYRVFPDLLTDRLAAEDAMSNQWPATSQMGCPPAKREDDWLSAFAIEALRMLETVPLESGTRGFQPFLLVLCSSELICESGEHVQSSEISEEGMNATFLDVVMVRKFVLDRLTTCLRMLPPKWIRVCIDIVKETWRRLDAGQKGVYWLDVMAEKGWETIMA